MIFFCFFVITFVVLRRRCLFAIFVFIRFFVQLKLVWLWLSLSVIDLLSKCKGCQIDGFGWKVRSCRETVGNAIECFVLLIIYKHLSINTHVLCWTYYKGPQNWLDNLKGYVLNAKRIKSDSIQL